MDMVSERWIDYNEGGYGVADLFSLSTGEIWEVKRCTVDYNEARAQLMGYVNGVIHRPDLRERLNGLSLRAGGTTLAMPGIVMPGTKITTKEFPKEHWDGSQYLVRYWDAGGGIVYYDYEMKKPESKSPVISPKTNKPSKKTNTMYIITVIPPVVVPPKNTVGGAGYHTERRIASYMF